MLISAVPYDMPGITLKAHELPPILTRLHHDTLAADPACHLHLE